jgi:hypothetical protein
MKNKIHPIAKRENTKESLIKFQMLTEKLGKHFKIRLRNLLEEKNYKYTQLLLDIKSFFRQMEDVNFETEQIVPKMEKYLIDILSRQINNQNKYDINDTNNNNYEIYNTYNNDINNNKTNGAIMENGNLNGKKINSILILILLIIY